MPDIDFKAALNAQQLPAVTHGDGPQLVIAGAGSGQDSGDHLSGGLAGHAREASTRHGSPPSTFTNKAAGEMKGRIEELLGIYPLPSFVGTFHRFALRLLRAYGNRVDLPRDFSILDSSDQMSLLKKAMKAEELSTDAYRPPAVLSAISSAKNRLLDPRQYEAEAGRLLPLASGRTRLPALPGADARGRWCRLRRHDPASGPDPTARR